jgi:hypothetical protein
VVRWRRAPITPWCAQRGGRPGHRQGPFASPVPSWWSGCTTWVSSRRGIPADIIVVPGDPSEDIRATKDVSFVMKDGQADKGP